jgi:hypothetical protein
MGPSARFRHIVNQARGAGRDNLSHPSAASLQYTGEKAGFRLKPSNPRSQGGCIESFVQAEWQLSGLLVFKLARLFWLPRSLTRQVDCSTLCFRL